MWARARSLASAYAEAYDEDVAEVLGEALLEVLAEMLVPEEDRAVECLGCGQNVEHSLEECVAEAKAQHPAYRNADLPYLRAMLTEN